MSSFSKDYVAFLRSLARNNNREWFHANKKRYETSVKEPFHDFVEEMIHRVGALDPRIRIEPKDAIFRIHRDIRFSKDKTPYKPFLSAVVSAGGRRDQQMPGIYFQFGAKDVSIAGGMYQPDKDALYNVRSAIRDRGQGLDKLVNAKAFKALFGELKGEKNKVLPKEFKAAQGRFPLIAHKQFYYWVEYPAETVLRDDLATFVLQHYKTGKKLGDWLFEAAKG
jgi:uncharacterized protein (TIGR02453 family)